MRKTKKILALLLAIVTLLSVMAIPTFAAKSLPSVKSVKFIDTNPISIKEMENYFAEADDWLELQSYDLRSEDDFTVEREVFYLSNSNFDYEFEVVLSNGDTITLDSYGYYAPFNEDYEIYLDAYVAYGDYVAAKNGTSKKVNVTVDIYVQEWEKFEEVDPYTFTLQKATKDAYVLSIAPVSGIPTYVYKYCDYIHNLIGGKFLVTYADKKTETLTVTLNEYNEYLLGDKPLYVIDNGDKLRYEFLDATYEKNIIKIAEPFKSIKITECNFDAKKDSVSLKYEVTTTKDVVKSFEYSIENVEFYSYYEVGEYLGYYIWLYVSEYEETPDGKIDADNYCITVETAYDNVVSDTYKVENPMGFFVAIRVWFENLISRIEYFFYELFGWM